MIWYIYKEGVYGHGVHGIYDTHDAAIAACEACAALDVDSYHEWLVYEVELNAHSTQDEAQGEGIGGLPIFRKVKDKK